MIHHISMYTHNKVLLSLFLCFLHIGVMKALEKTVTIDISSFYFVGSGYKECEWRIGNISGIAKCSKDDYWRFSSSYGSYLYNETPIPGNIRSIKLTSAFKQSCDWEWYLYVSNKHINVFRDDEYVTKEKLNIKSAPAIWTTSEGECYSYFRLELFKGNPCYIQSITITYEVPSLTLVAHTADTYYATFSNSESVFFPRSAVEVMAVDVAGTSLVYNPLELKTGMHVGDQMMDGYVVPKNTGVLLSSADTSIPYYYYSTTESTMPDNKLQPASVKMSGDYLFYKLAYNDYEKQTDLGFYWGKDGGTAFEVKPGTAYLQVPKTTAAKAFLFDSQADGISRVEEPKQHDGSVYDLQGNRISKLQRGINIVNGKKVYVR